MRVMRGSKYAFFAYEESASTQRTAGRSVNITCNIRQIFAWLNSMAASSVTISSLLKSDSPIVGMRGCDLAVAHVPPRIQFKFGDTHRKMSRVLYSRRIDFTARKKIGDLELRRDWQSKSESNFWAGDTWSRLFPLGGEVELFALSMRGPCFAAIRWRFGDVHLHLAVRPGRPYRDWGP